MPLNINTRLSHIEKSLIAQPGERIDLPRTVSDTIHASIEAKGWQALVETNRLVSVEFASAVGPTTFVFFTLPRGEFWYVAAADVRHNDPAAKECRIDLFHDPLIGSALMDTISLPQHWYHAIPRPVFLSPGTGLSAECLTAVGAGNQLFLRVTYIRLEEGEYVPASPYG